jgi:lipid A 3-O-deacylase
MKIIFATLVMMFALCTLWAQAIDNTPCYKNINADSYFRINYENDFFCFVDKYYTQGITLELVAPWVGKFPISALLIKPNYDHVRHGIGIEHNVYTPTLLGPSIILYGDRPFAATLFLKTFCIATDAINKQRFSTSINTGILGQAAFGAEMQTAIHRALGDETPHGWPNQLHNDAILNYEIEYEKQLVSVPKFFSLSTDGLARAGTLSDKVGVGINLIGGYFDNPFNMDVINKSVHIYAYNHAGIAAIVYDASLQGGVFNHTSPYTIVTGNMQHVVIEERFGFVFNYRKICAEYAQTFLSSEFKGGGDHRWGSVELAFGL